MLALGWLGGDLALFAQVVQHGFHEPLALETLRLQQTRVADYQCAREEHCLSVVATSLPVYKTTMHRQLNVSEVATEGCTSLGTEMWTKADKPY